jgi:hypothetical protein
MWQMRFFSSKQTGSRETDRKGPGVGGKHTQGTIHSDLLPEARLYLLKFPELPKMAPTAGDQVPSTKAFWGTFHIQNITKLFKGIPLVTYCFQLGPTS